MCVCVRERFNRNSTSHSWSTIGIQLTTIHINVQIKHGMAWHGQYNWNVNESGKIVSTYTKIYRIFFSSYFKQETYCQKRWWIVFSRRLVVVFFFFSSFFIKEKSADEWLKAHVSVPLYAYGRFYTLYTVCIFVSCFFFSSSFSHFCKIWWKQSVHVQRSSEIHMGWLKRMQSFLLY